MNESKYSESMREQIVEYILESGQSATRVADGLRIDVNTVCKWLREYRVSHKVPIYSEEKREE